MMRMKICIMIKFNLFVQIYYFVICSKLRFILNFVPYVSILLYTCYLFFYFQISLTLPQLLSLEAKAASGNGAPSAKTKSVILVWLSGGPAGSIAIKGRAGSKKRAKPPGATLGCPGLLLCYLL